MDYETLSDMYEPDDPKLYSLLDYEPDWTQMEYEPVSERNEPEVRSGGTDG